MSRANRNEPLVPAFGVKLNGTALGTDVMPWITSVTVIDDREAPGMFVLTLASREVEDGIFPWTDDKRFNLKGQVQVSLGYGGVLEPVISGQITSLEPKFEMGGAPTLTVRGLDVRHLLNTVPQSAGYRDQTAPEIAAEVFRRARVASEATQESAVKFMSIFQNRQTDLQFLLELASAVDYQLVTRGDKVAFEPVPEAMSVIQVLSPAEDLLDFETTLTLVPETDVELRSVNAEQAEQITATGTPPRGKRGQRSSAEQAEISLGKRTTRVMFHHVASQAEADLIARSSARAAARDFVKAEGKCLGRPDLRVGAVVHIADVGRRFSGDYYVTGVSHNFSANEGYITAFSACRSVS